MIVFDLFGAVAVLSDGKRRALYDAGLYDPVQDDEEEVEVHILIMFS